MSSAPAGWLTDLFAELGSGSPATPPERVEAPPELVATLRRRLAIRGRTPPRTLLPPDTSQAIHQAALAAVLPDCDPGVADEGWLLRNGPRRAVLGGIGPHYLRDILARDPAREDPTWLALSAFGDDPASAVASLPPAAASELQRLPQVLGGAFADLVDVPAVRWQTARRRRRDELARVAEGFVGRDREKKLLHRFLRADLHNKELGPAPVRAMLLHGKGGSGKSALMATVLATMLDDVPDLPLVRLDFDRPALDPLSSNSLDIELLEQLRLTSPECDGQLGAVSANIQRLAGKPNRSSGVSIEAAVSTSRLSLEGSLSWLRKESRPLLLILDSTEQVVSGGSARVAALLDWLGRLAAGSGAPEIRVVISGRVDADLWLRPATKRQRTVNVLAIGDQSQAGDEARRCKLSGLSRGDALNLLVEREVPVEMAERLATTFERNPLILCLLAELVAVGDPIDIREGKLPAGLVQGYLYGRILKHLDPAIRPYAHPGLALPILTAEVIAEVLGPLVGEPSLSLERARLILQGLTRPGWLVEQVGEGIRLRPDLRAFTLQLMMSDQDPAQAARITEAHRAAGRWHGAKQGAEHRALALYHRLMLEPAEVPEQLPPGVEPYLLPLLDDLPASAREALRMRMGRSVGLETAAEMFSDIDWDTYLREDGGLASRVSDSSGDPAVLLDLWRRRPSGPPGEPPTAILQCLADSGEWNTNEASPSLIVRRMNQTGVEKSETRIYWACALALLGSSHRIETDEAEALDRAGRKVISRRTAEFVDLLALAALLHDDPAEMFWPVLSNAPSSVSARFMQAAIASRLGLGRTPMLFDLSEVIVIQKNWLETHREWCRALRIDWPVSDQMSLAQATFDGTDGKSLAYLSIMSALADLAPDRPAFLPMQVPTGPEALLFRGLTSELHRPIRQALRTALTDDAVAIVLARFRPHLSICPVELEPSSLLIRLSRDPAASWLQLVQFADRARTLGPLLDIAHQEAPSSPLLASVRETFHAWDRALGLGHSSAWTI